MSSLSGALCRDCFARPPDQPRRCPVCGSPRLRHHPEIDALAIAHVDCDAFYASIEKRDDPALRDVPLIVGGGRRGVVSTCCYIARTFGVRSAMPMFKALKLCPDAHVVPPDMAKYGGVGRQIREMMRALTPLVEPLSIDEAFLDLSGTERLHGMSPAATLARFAARVEADVGVTVSIGLSYCKFLAKLASELDKPRGFAVVGRREAVGFLAAQPIGAIWGIGAVASARFARDGLTTIADLQRSSEKALIARYGAEGSRLWRLAHGVDLRPVSPHRETKSVSAETTFGDDIADPAALAAILHRLAEKVSGRLKAQSLAGRTVTLKLKTADFKIRTRARALPEPTQLTPRIFGPARELLGIEADGTPFRLIGVGLSDFCSPEDADRGDLVDTGIGRQKATETAIDALREKFGRQAVIRGITFEGRPNRRG